MLIVKKQENIEDSKYNIYSLLQAQYIEYNSGKQNRSPAKRLMYFLYYVFIYVCVCVCMNWIICNIGHKNQRAKVE